MRTFIGHFNFKKNLHCTCAVSRNRDVEEVKSDPIFSFHVPVPENKQHAMNK